MSRAESRFGLRPGKIGVTDADLLFEGMEAVRGTALLCYSQSHKGRFPASNPDTRAHYAVVATTQRDLANAMRRALIALGVGPLPEPLELK